jgi:DNA polymerase III subunit epsilon
MKMSDTPCNPERNMPADAVAVHGLTAEFLADKPPFDHVADEVHDRRRGAL